MWTKRLLFIFLSFLVVSPVLQSQDALQQLEQSILETLELAEKSNNNLKNEMIDLKTQLIISKQLSAEQKKTLETLEVHLKNSEDSFKTISESLETYKMNLKISEQKIKEKNKILLIMGIAGAIIIALKILGGILYFKNIPVPRIVDWLL